MENRVAFATGTTSGISQVIDPYGRMTATSGLYERAAIIGPTFTVPERSLYTRLGDWFGWLLVVALLALLGIAFGHARRGTRGVCPA